MNLISRLFLALHIRMARDAVATAEALREEHLRSARHARTTVIPKARAHLARLESQQFARQFPSGLTHWAGRNTDGRWNYR